MKFSVRMRLVILVGASTFPSLVACRHFGPPPSESEVKFGFNAPIPEHLIRVPNGSQIRICGAHFEELKWAITTWGEALGRAYDLVESCDAPHIQSFGPEDPKALADCAHYGFDNRMYVLAMRPLQVVDCKKTPPTAYRRSLLHEAGHLFGLCDQYPEQIQNCISSTEVVPGSVMHAAVTETLTADDIIGIKAMAAAYPASGEPTLPVALQTGDYRGSNDTVWHVVSTLVEGRSSSVTLTVGETSWTFACGQEGGCMTTPGGAKLLPVSATTFLYTIAAGKSTVFERVP